MTYYSVSGIKFFSDSSDSAKEVVRHIQYSFSIRNKTNQLLHDAGFTTYLPVSRTLAQRCCDKIEISGSHRLELDESGNQKIHFDFSELAPFDSRVRRVGVELAVAEEAPASGGDLSLYLRGEPWIEMDHPAIRKRATALRVGEVRVETARRIHDWVNQTIKDTGYNVFALGALHALEKGTGDCTESMALFIALARANGIPARGVAGFVVDRDALLKARDYHNWAEFHDGGRWRIADPNKGVFMRNERDYIAMQILTPAASDEGNRAQPLVWTNREEVEVRMN